MNNNRNNNRRRGRSNRGQGGGNQANRIDNRARGNAPQMLEKYKKLAHDASLNGDRVQTEYYLQFADHYFRVIADNKAQKDDPRGRRDNERDQDDDGDDGDTGAGTGTEETPGRRDREPNRSRRRDGRGNRDNEEGDPGSEGENASADEEENPFGRESKPRRTRRAARANGTGAAADETTGEATGEVRTGLDPDSLPPAIGAGEKSAESEPRPRRRTRRTREAGGDDETLEAVS